MKVVQLSRGRPKAAKRARSVAEEAFFEAWGSRAPAVVRELEFHPERGWRFDFAWPEYMVALELEGLGRHQKIDGYRKDCDKYTEAAILGWCVLRRMSCDMAEVDRWVALVERAIDQRRL